MAVITDKLFKTLVTRLSENKDYVYNEPVNKLLGGAGKWTNSDVQATLDKFKSQGIVAETYYREEDKGTSNEGRLWIRIYNKTHKIEEINDTQKQKTTEETVEKREDTPIKYYKNNVYNLYEYDGNIDNVPSWITDKCKVVSTNKPDGEFKLIIGEDDWLLVQENDVIVYDVTKERFTVYDSVRETKRLYISEKVIAEEVYS